MSRLSDLNDHLFNQLDRLSKGDLTADQIDQEVKRADAIVAIADQVVSNAQTQLKAAALFGQYGKSILPHLPMIGPSVQPQIGKTE
jgi:hypothetical protein